MAFPLRWPAALALAPFTVAAQGQAPEATLPEITVTVNKQAESLDAVPASVSVFDGAALENERKLEGAHRRMESLELTASEMFDSIVKAGGEARGHALDRRSGRNAGQRIAHAAPLLSPDAVHSEFKSIPTI